MTSHEDEAHKMEVDSEKLSLMSNDKRIFVVEKEVIGCMTMLKDMMDNLKLGYDSITTSEPILLANVDGQNLHAVIKWCDKHKNDVNLTMPREKMTYMELSQWDKDFIKSFDNQQLICLLNAASYLDVKGLLNVCCIVIAKDLEVSSVEEIRKRFNIENDLTDEEERQLKLESVKIGLD